MSRFIYYPGCSMDSSARAYADSIDEGCRPLGLDFDEIDDWNCCVATEYLSISPLRAYALISRNLALAEKQKDGSRELVAPCSACFVNLAKTDHYLREDATLSRKVNTALSVWRSFSSTSANLSNKLTFSGSWTRALCRKVSAQSQRFSDMQRSINSW